jgi:hypothetical protein
MRRPETNEDDATLALGALAWVLSDAARAERFLALTGIDPADLRARAGDPVLLVQLLGHLEGHEPDLIACADALSVPPARLVAARAALDAA